MTNKEIAVAFSRHQFESLYSFFAEDIKWSLIGAETYQGKNSVINTCENSIAYLKTVTAALARFVVIEGDGYVVVDAITEFTGADQKISKVASCDIYKFGSGLLVEISSYNIEVK